jgi:hypothetical protein
MAKLVDALDLGSSGSHRGGSSPSTRTINTVYALVAKLVIRVALKMPFLNRVSVRVRPSAPHFIAPLVHFPYSQVWTNKTSSSACVSAQKSAARLPRASLSKRVSLIVWPISWMKPQMRLRRFAYPFETRWMNLTSTVRLDKTPTLIYTPARRSKWLITLAHIAVDALP